MAEPLLVVGLGNPGPRYETTRHNVGFLVADILADRIGSGFKVHKKSGAEVTTGRLGGRSVVLAKPRTSMNESGRQVGPLANFYSVAPADVITAPTAEDLESEGAGAVTETADAGEAAEGADEASAEAESE